MKFEFRLPDIGEGIAEGEITQWHVTVGQTVKEDDEFLEVMTDKATVEIPCPKAGTIAEIRFKAGETAPVGSVIAVIDAVAASGGPSKAAGPASAAGNGASSPPSSTASPVKSAPAPSAPTQSAPTQSAPTQSAPTKAAPGVKVPTVAGGGGASARPLVSGRVLASPAVRRRAREAGVDLHEVSATGPAGRVTRQDFEAHLERVGELSGPPVSPQETSTLGSPRSAVPGSEDRIPLRGIRRKIAERMAQAKRTAAHFTYVDEVDVTELVALREELKPTALEQGVKLTYMPFIVHAVIHGLKKFPMLNASLDDAAEEIVVKHYYHIGFAADTEAGLVVPVVKDADQKSLLGVGAAIQDLAGRAREGKLSRDDVTGSTFTITNAGNIGGILATPIINFPEVAILGVHKIADRAVVREGQIVVRKMMNLSISIDHRLVDGADGARFMNEVIACLQSPKRLLLGSV